ncbi:hypothetical protein DIPPA_03445 [Diplonema papillatum]|nr:hypothetical protein DIPPA_03445 [Diplonema papillatum]
MGLCASKDADVDGNDGAHEECPMTQMPAKGSKVAAPTAAAEYTGVADMKEPWAGAEGEMQNNTISFRFLKGMMQNGQQPQAGPYNGQAQPQPAPGSVGYKQLPPPCAADVGQSNAEWGMAGGVAGTGKLARARQRARSRKGSAYDQESMMAPKARRAQEVAAGAVLGMPNAADSNDPRRFKRFAAGHRLFVDLAILGAAPGNPATAKPPRGTAMQQQHKKALASHTAATTSTQKPAAHPPPAHVQPRRSRAKTAVVSLPRPPKVYTQPGVSQRTSVSLPASPLVAPASQPVFGSAAHTEQALPKPPATRHTTDRLPSLPHTVVPPRRRKMSTAGQGRRPSFYKNPRPTLQQQQQLAEDAAVEEQNRRL